MLERLNKRRIYPIAMAVLIVFTTVLLFRSGRAVSEVISLRNDLVVDDGGRQRKLHPAAIRAAAKDSLLLEIDGAIPDPFRSGSTRSVAVVATEILPLPPVYSLDMKGLLFDHEQSVVKLCYGPESSGWLGVGESFRKWEIIEISPRNVIVRKGERTRVLD